ncbi:acyl-CoA reductase-like NAD-dependent aldehyde dehydrogenase [Amycolatopsis bartoniae]|uniref:Aldehyde dehydrogenase n=1 Tax=Amycolatopsis bartoniae TaxID=941986 RepID=A0A8H9M3V4_9PSEU|nr:aldehyde dehydrogenase family protein [Amycolatopsis bartoniae]MBB2937952.1 acyl-CoA reductase-like NAD-dependent aldehyde dehydrogenase [Amycolatopsis bartoniae]GHF41928.1 aldehyde dehydrogenase [Amycolatopsis bartoniae]
MLEHILEAARSADPVEAPAFVAGRWSRDGSPAERVGPYVRRVVSRSFTAGEEQVRQAARFAGESAAAVARLAPATRATILERAARLATERRDDVARLIALELGKPVKDGRAELDRVADTFAVCAGETRHIGGDTLPVAGWARGIGNTAMTYRAPAGVALAITPFNAPANLLAHKLGASFAAGNTTLVKAPPQAPATTAAVVALLLEAGLPPEAVQLLHGGGEVGAALCAAREVSVISFTGSAETGHAVARAAGAKRLVLELGGNAATLVCADADVALAAKTCARTGYSNSGQSCISVQRVYVHRSRFDEFLAAFRTEVEALEVGDPLDPATDVGSMVDEAAAARVEKWTAEAVAGGARVVTGGTRDGATLCPTIVADPAPDATLVVEEVFGALVAVLPFDDVDAVIAACNASRFGLQAGAFTHDVRTIVRLWRELQVGGLVVNGSSNYRLDHVPFGGVKDSGFGRESPAHMIDDYTVVKTLILRGLSIWGDR